MDYYGDPGGMPPMYTDPWQLQQGGMGGLPPGWWMNEMPPQYGGTPVPYGDMAAWLAALLSGGNNGATPWEEQIRQSGGEAPQQPAPQPNEGQTVETPQGTPPSQDGTFSTDVYGNGSNLGGIALGAGGLGAALAALAGMGGGPSQGAQPAQGMTNPTFSATGTATPPADFSVTGYGQADPSWSPSVNTPTMGGTSFQTGPMSSPLVSTPGGGGGQFPVSIFPSLVGGLGGLLGGIFGGGGGSSPQQPSQPTQGQQGQQGQAGAMAQIPFLAAQGGSTAIPAPYAQLPPQTPVGSVFKAQPHARRVMSLGELLSGGFGG